MRAEVVGLFTSVFSECWREPGTREAPIVSISLWVSDRDLRAGESAGKYKSRWWIQSKGQLLLEMLGAQLVHASCSEWPARLCSLQSWED